MILVLGDGGFEVVKHLEGKGFRVNHEEILEGHVKFVGARSRDQFIQKVMTFKPLGSLKTICRDNGWSFDFYEEKLGLFAAGPKVALHDSRVLWFWDQFVKLAQPVRVIVAYGGGETAYDKRHRKLIEDRIKGLKDVLVLGAFEAGAVNQFLEGPPVVEGEPKV